MSGDKTAVVLCCVCWVFCAGASGLGTVSVPSMDLSSQTPSERAVYMSNLLQVTDPELWWVRMGDEVVGPGARAGSGRIEDLEENESDEVQGTRADDFMLYTGDGNGLPEPLQPLSVAAVSDASLYLIRKPENGEDVLVRDFQDNAQTLVSGQQLLVKVEEEPSERSLEEDDDVFEVDLDTVTPTTYEATLRRFIDASVVGSDSPPQRYVGTKGHDHAQSYLISELEKIDGIRVAKQAYSISGRGTGDIYQGTNVVGCLPGKTRDFVAVGGHTDTLPSGSKTPSPGAMDDGSGVAAALMTIQKLSDARESSPDGLLPCTVCATFFDGEEHGLTGSHEIARFIKAQSRSLEEDEDDRGGRTQRRLSSTEDGRGKAGQKLGNFMGAVVSDMSTGYKGEEDGMRMEERDSEVDDGDEGLASGEEWRTVVGEEAKSISRGIDFIRESLGLEEEDDDDDDDDRGDAGWRHKSGNVKLRGGVEASTNNEGVHIDGNGAGYNKGFFDAFVQAGKHSLINGEVYQSSAAIWNSDHKAFFSENLPAVDICAANHRKYAYWHDEHDTIDQLDFTTGPEVVKTMVLGIRNLMAQSKDKTAQEPYTLADALSAAATSDRHRNVVEASTPGDREELVDESKHDHVKGVRARTEDVESAVSVLENDVALLMKD